MALPALGTIAGWFTSGGAVSKIFDWIGDTFSSKSAIIAAQWVTVTALFTARIAFLVAVAEAGRLTLNGFNALLAQLPTLLTQNDLLSLAYNLMRSVGLIDAFKDSFAVFNVLFISIITAWVLKFAYHTAKLSSDELYKIGMLTLQD